jgi:hypothetical protein
MKIHPQTEQYLRSSGVELIAAKTESARETYNDLSKSRGVSEALPVRVRASGVEARTLCTQVARELLMCSDYPEVRSLSFSRLIWTSGSELCQLIIHLVS